MAASLWRSEERSEDILRLGRRQLESLRQEGHPYGDARVRSLRRLLAEGGGLPLLFPEHDVGFVYDEGGFFTGAKGRPTISPLQRSSSSGIRLGGRMPHFVLRRLDGANTLGSVPDAPRLLSTVDLPDQLRGLLLDHFRAQDSIRSPANGSEVASGNEREGPTSCGHAVDASRAGLVSVLIVASPLSAVVWDGGIHSDTSGFAAEAASTRWRDAAISVQQEQAGFASCPLVVLTVYPLRHAAATDEPRSGFADESATEVKDGGTGVVRAGSSKGTSLSAEEDSPWRLDAVTALEHLEPYLDRNGKATIQSRTAQRSAVTARSTRDVVHGNESGSFGGKVSTGPGLVLSMHATDDHDGNLGKAFAAAGAQAVLLRPDGHVSWIAEQSTDSTNYEEGEGYEPKGELGSALKAVYAGGGGP